MHSHPKFGKSVTSLVDRSQDEWRESSEKDQDEDAGDDAAVVVGAAVHQHDLRRRCSAGSHPHQEHPGGDARKSGIQILFYLITVQLCIFNWI